MTENGKPKNVGLMWWLIILTAISGIIWGYLIWTTGVPYHWGVYFEWFTFVSDLFVFLLTPAMLLLSWIFWWREKRGLSILFSIIQVIISLCLALLLVVVLAFM